MFASSRNQTSFSVQQLGSCKEADNGILTMFPRSCKEADNGI
ncbi:hypothetical protein HanHA89_Chr08g0298191 [Helianthus annuus]|nr:hypothetical protein HanHA89_Chr08g0298191 [Helianthus annuus]